MRLLGALIALAILGGCAVTQIRADRTESDAEARWPPVGRFVEVDGLRVHYVQKGRGPDVVLLHGASGNLRDFTFQLVDLLARDYRVTAFDRPGLGYTTRDARFAGAFNTRAETPQDQAAILARAAAQLGVTRPVVVGHSYGGSVAMAWGLDQNAAAVVSLGGAIMPWPGSLDAQYQVLGSALGGAIVPQFVSAFYDEARVREAVSGIFAPQSVPEGYLDHIGPGLSLRRDTIRANGRQVAALRPALVEMSKRYPTLTIPVELVHGSADTTVGYEIHTVAAAKLLPNAHVTRLEGVGHMPQHARPGAVLEAIRRAAQRAGLR
ncbi:alpha/beta fold hydrolase [Maliponia aquimaris]|uniref:Dihydrolipoyllysine-residue acetyltransferase component of acetoin cleaving system n=1 Tax=Maliponia aquimaris TaxID=1673631 RepID=A0A238KZN5_9RHOB|nr:alpha/beta hydrolase [Maliponia aquimaris]SMX48304.1 Dihydrolipoyllysine-residue acetyltransferase component of acetoin cleaving system [Maliponia aquimaris]